MNYELKFKTDVGKKRDHNEDAFGVVETDDLTVYIVCDGMGGHAAGEVASKIAVDTIKEVIENSVGEEPNIRLARATKESNRKIREYAENNSGAKGMGTTVVMVAIEHLNIQYEHENTCNFIPTRNVQYSSEEEVPLAPFKKGGIPTADHRPPTTDLYTAHVGDSRIYRISGKKIEQIGKDHSQVQKLIDEGALTPEEARQSRLKNVLLQALGSEEEIKTEIHGPITPKPGDAFLLCSDGLNDMLEDNKIAKIVSKNNAEQAAEKLINAANEAGGKDNITVCIVKFPVVGGRWTVVRNLIPSFLKGVRGI